MEKVKKSERKIMIIVIIPITISVPNFQKINANIYA